MVERSVIMIDYIVWTVAVLLWTIHDILIYGKYVGPFEMSLRRYRISQGILGFCILAAASGLAGPVTALAAFVFYAFMGCDLLYYLLTLTRLRKYEDYYWLKWFMWATPISLIVPGYEPSRGMFIGSAVTGFILSMLLLTFL